jgi:hypothetical protein
MRRTATLWLLIAALGPLIPARAEPQRWLSPSTPAAGGSRPGPHGAAPVGGSVGGLAASPALAGWQGFPAAMSLSLAGDLDADGLTDEWDPDDDADGVFRPGRQLPAHPETPISRTATWTASGCGRQRA